MRQAALAIALALAIAPAHAQVVRTGDVSARGMTERDFPRVIKLADNIYAYEELANEIGGNASFTTKAGNWQARRLLMTKKKKSTSTRTSKKPTAAAKGRELSDTDLDKVAGGRGGTRRPPLGKVYGGSDMGQFDKDSD